LRRSQFTGKRTQECPPAIPRNGVEKIKEKKPTEERTNCRCFSSGRYFVSGGKKVLVEGGGEIGGSDSVCRGQVNGGKHGAFTKEKP